MYFSFNGLVPKTSLKFSHEAFSKSSICSLGCKGEITRVVTDFNTNRISRMGFSKFSIGSLAWFSVREVLNGAT